MTFELDEIDEWLIGFPLEADARRAIEVARMQSARLRRGPVWSAELLCGITSATGSAGERALAAFGITRDVVREWLDTELGSGTAPPGAERHYSVSMQTILALARAEAREARRARLTTADLLMGVVREPRMASTMTGAFLARHGVTFERTFETVGGGRSRQPSNLRASLPPDDP